MKTVKLAFMAILMLGVSLSVTAGDMCNSDDTDDTYKKCLALLMNSPNVCGDKQDCIAKEAARKQEKNFYWRKKEKNKKGDQIKFDRLRTNNTLMKKTEYERHLDDVKKVIKNYNSYTSYYDSNNRQKIITMNNRNFRGWLNGKLNNKISFCERCKNYFTCFKCKLVEICDKNGKIIGKCIEKCDFHQQKGKFTKGKSRFCKNCFKNSFCYSKNSNQNLVIIIAEYMIIKLNRNMRNIFYDKNHQFKSYEIVFNDIAEGGVGYSSNPSFENIDLFSLGDYKVLMGEMEKANNFNKEKDECFTLKFLKETISKLREEAVKKIGNNKVKELEQSVKDLLSDKRKCL